MKTYTSFYYFLFISLLLTINLPAQTASYVAKAGSSYLTTNEYHTRLEFMPYIKTSRDADSLKDNFIHALLAEKLFAAEGRIKGFDKSEKFTGLYLPLEKILLRDALYREVIDKNIKVTNEEISKGMERSKDTLVAGFLISIDSTEIFNLYSKLSAGAGFDSLLKLRHEYSAQTTPIKVSFGSLDEKTEDVLYALSPGSFSAPVKVSDGWYIYYLRQKIHADSAGSSAGREVIEEIIKNKKKQTAETAYMQWLIDPLKSEPDSILLNRVAVKITERLRGKTAPGSRQPVYLSEYDLDEIKAEFGPDTLKKSFIKIKGKSSSLRDFLNQYYYTNFLVVFPSVKNVLRNLRIDFYKFVEDEALAAEAYRKKVDKLPAVQVELSMWRNSFLAGIYRNSILNSIEVSENDVSAYYKNMKSVQGAKLQQVVSGDLQVIQAVILFLSRGRDIKQSADTSIIQETGFIPLSQLGEQGLVIPYVNNGDIFGPVKTENGYSIFKVVDKKDIINEIPNDYENAKPVVIAELLNNRMFSVLRNKLKELVKKYKIEINEKELAKIPVKFKNNIPFRNIGFGGRLSVVPYTYPLFSW